MPASQKFSTGGRTDRAHEETIKGSSVPGKGIKIRRFQIGVTIHAKVSPTLVIGQKYNHVRFRMENAPSPKYKSG